MLTLLRACCIVSPPHARKLTSAIAAVLTLQAPDALAKDYCVSTGFLSAGAVAEYVFSSVPGHILQVTSETPGCKDVCTFRFGRNQYKIGSVTKYCVSYDKNALEGGDCFDERTVSLSFIDNEKRISFDRDRLTPCPRKKNVTYVDFEVFPHYRDPRWDYGSIINKPQERWEVYVMYFTPYKEQ